MKEKKQEKKGFSFALVVTYVLLIAALATYVMPIWRVEMKPLGAKSWSVHELVKAIPRPVLKKETAPAGKQGFDFHDVLKNLSKPSVAGEPKKLTSTFVIGIFVPIMLALTYLLVLLGFVLAPVKAGKPFNLVSGLMVLASGYVLAATYYLSVLAQKSFAEGLKQAGEGIFAVLGTAIAPQLSIRPDVGLLTLFALTVVIFVVNFTRKKA